MERHHLLGQVDNKKWLYRKNQCLPGDVTSVSLTPDTDTFLFLNNMFITAFSLSGAVSVRVSVCEFRANSKPSCMKKD